MIKSIFKRLVYTPPDLSPRFILVKYETCRTQIFFETQKDRPDFFYYFGLPLRGMQRVNWLQLRTLVCCIKLCFGDIHYLLSLSNGVVGETMS